MFRNRSPQTTFQPSSDGHLIDLRQVTKVYDTPAGAFVVLKQIDLQIDAGQFAAVVGRSGSGKSTLLNMITGIDHPTSGAVWVGGKAVHAMNEEQIAIWRGRTIGVVFQFFQLMPSLSALDNVMLPMDFCSVYSRQERQKPAMKLLEQVGLAHHAHKLPAALSGGEQQRVAIARALANDPPIIVADEPTGNLDSNTVADMLVLFDNLVAQGKTILMVSHDHDLARRARRVITLADGAIVEQAEVQYA